MSPSAKANSSGEVAFELPSLVTPVVWYYGPGGLERGLGGGVPAHAWQLYARAFPALWAASAYKGANGSSKMMSTTCRYVSNQKYWVQQIQRREQQFHFHGVILTGWSRYDHFATLCEILPVSMGSLAACLHVYQQTPGPAPTGDELNVFHAELISRLHEGGTVEEIVGERPVVEDISAELPRLDSWPFEDAARAVAKFSCLRDQGFSVVRGDGYGVHSWLNPWHVARGYTNPAQLQSMAEDTGLILSRLLQTKESIESQLAPILGKRSFEEWMATFVQPIVEQMTEIHEQADAAVKREPGVVPAIMQ